MTDLNRHDAKDARRKLPDGWRWVRLGEAIRETQLGFACGQRDPNGTVQLRMNNVTDRGGFDWSTITRVPADPETIQMYRLQLGDVLFNNTNSTDLVGKAAIFEGFDEPVVFSNHFTRLRTLDDLLSPSFLALWLRKQWQDRLFANICNRWIGQSAVQRDKLLALKIPLPPLPEQQRIAAILNEQMAAVEHARKSIQEELAAINALPAALLRRAFSGEL
jgi:type I restriction enzyme S subunit